MERITLLTIGFGTLFLSACLGHAQIRVLSPRSLADEFAMQNGKIQGSTAMFGAPFYGDRIMGRLVYGESKQNHCNASEYSLEDMMTIKGKSRSHDQVRLINIVIVRRGSCSFVTKVRVASKKGAHAVVIVDKNNSNLTSHDLQNFIVADDGYGKAISIPSILVSHLDGDKLIDAARKGEVLVELAWDIPTGKIVAIDLWMSSGSTESQLFLKTFSGARRALNQVLKFTPHYHVFSASPEAGSYNGLCSDATARFCAPDPEAGGEISGRDVLEEDIRQLCLHEQTRVPRIYVEEDYKTVVFFAQEWWNYVEAFPERCPFDGKDAISKFGEACSYQLMRELSVNTDKVRDCARNTKNSKLEYERINKAWSSRALRVNGWRYSGALDAELVTRAVCSGFVNKPEECEKTLKPRNPTEKYLAPKQGRGVNRGTLIAMLIGMIVLVACIMCLYRRFLNKSLHIQIRDEVMLEVSSKMDEYRKLPQV